MSKRKTPHHASPGLVNGQDLDLVLRDTDGEEWRSRDYLGKMIIIHACRGEF